MPSKNKIRLSRSLQVQTSPYPTAGQWLKKVMFLFTLIMGVGIFFMARPEEAQPEPNSAVSPKQILGEKETGVEYQLYEVQRGDTLFNLSQRYDLSWQTLAEINNLKEPYILKIGQKIKLPLNN